MHAVSTADTSAQAGENLVTNCAKFYSLFGEYNYLS